MISTLTYPLPNGVTVSVNAAMDGFIKKGHEVIIVSPKYYAKKKRPEHYPIKSSFIIKGLGIIIGKEERSFAIGSQSKIKEISNQFQPDAYWLHTLTWAPNAFEKFMIKSKKPKVLFYHTLVEDYGRIYAGKIGAYTMKKRSKSVCNKMDAIMTPSSMMKKKLESYGVIKPIYVIPTGIDSCPNPFTKKELKEKFKIPAQFKILLYVGRVSKEKNLNVLLKTMKKLKDNNFKAVLLIVGPGDIKETKQEINKMGIKDRVILTGALPKEETVRTYGGADAFVFSSTTETQGLVVGEAMISNTPVIALDSPIQKEVYPEKTAVVVRDPEKFPQKIIDTFNNRKKTKLMVEKAKKYVLSNFSKKLMINRQVKVFKDLLENN